MVVAEPALTVAFCVTVNVTVDDPGVEQGAEGVPLVNVKVTVPLLPEIGVNVTAAGVDVEPVLLNWLEAVVMVPVTPVIVQVPVVEPPVTLAPASV